MKHARWLLPLSLPIALASCSDPTLCGDGTHVQGAECVAPLSTECAPGTKLVDSSCVPSDGSGGMCGPGTRLENGKCVLQVNVNGNAARFYEVNLTDPAALISLVNASFSASFLTGEQLIFVGTFAPTGSDSRLYGGSGKLNVDGSYTLDHVNAYDTPVHVTGSTLTTDPFTFSWKAFGAPNNVVLVDTTITKGLTTAPDGITMVLSGELRGVLTPANAANVYLQEANLTLLELLTSFEIPPDVDHDGDGVKESWVFGMSFSTIPVWLL